MKKSFMTRVLAMGLSTAMAFSVPVVGNFTTAFADTAASSSAALAMSFTQKDAEVGTRMVFSLKGSQASKWKVVRAASSDKAVAAIAKTTSKKVAVEAQGAGEAKVSVRVRKTKDNREKVLKIRLNIKAADPTIASVQQTDAAKLVVTLSKPVESVAAADFAVAKNDEAKTAVAVKSATLDETDKTKVTLETEKGMTDGQVYTVTYTAATENKTVSTAEFTAQTATVLGLASVAQTTTTKLTATFNMDASSAKKADFSLVRDEGQKTIVIKDVTVDATDKTKVTVETYDVLSDAKAYTLTYTAKAENGESVPSTAQFTATDGKIAALGLNKTTVTAGQAEEFKVQTLDSGNVVLNEYLLNQTAGNNLDVVVNPSGTGYMDGNALYLPNVGDTAEVRVTYHTYQYQNGVETGTITKAFTITAVAADNSVTGFDYSIVALGAGRPSWDASYKREKRIAVEDNKTVHFLFTNASGADKTSSYAVESSDETKMVIVGNNPEEGCVIYGVGTGTASILVRDKITNSVVATLPVTVLAKRVASRLEFDTPLLNVSTMDGVDAETVKPTLKDQYGDTMVMKNIQLDGATIFTAGGKNRGDAVDVTTSAITVTGSALQAVTSTVKVTATADNNSKVTNSFKVVASNPGTAVKFEVAFSGSKDITVGENDTKDKTLKVRLVGKDAKGVVATYAAIENISISTLGGSSLYDDSANIASVIEPEAPAKTRAAIINLAVLNGTGEFDKKVSAGNFNVKVTSEDNIVHQIYNNADEFNATLNVTDTQALPTVKVVSKNADYNTLMAVFTDPDKIKFYRNGSEVKAGIGADDTDVIVERFDCTNTNSGTTYTVKKVTVVYKVGKGDGARLRATLPVNMTFTNVTGEE